MGDLGYLHFFFWMLRGVEGFYRVDMCWPVREGCTTVAVEGSLKLVSGVVSLKLATEVESIILID